MEKRASEAVSVYFVASPLQYLAASTIAKIFERDSKNILIYYKKGVEPLIDHTKWDAVAYLPWPRFEPLPGPFGKIKRLRQNLYMVADIIGVANEIRLHSAVFDTEAINYFVKGLPKIINSATVRARILPDGIISIKRYPLPFYKVVLQYFRKARLIVDRNLDYACFRGDRIGSDAAFVDRIYTIKGLPHEYDERKVVVLDTLIETNNSKVCPSNMKALVIGQPLCGAGLMTREDSKKTSQEILQWLKAKGIEEIDYKPHPKDPNFELLEMGYNKIEIDEPLESFLAKNYYTHIVGVRSSTLVLARQIYGKDTDIVAFGWDKIKFKSTSEKESMMATFIGADIKIL